MTGLRNHSGQGVSQDSTQVKRRKGALFPATLLFSCTFLLSGCTVVINQTTSSPTPSVPEAQEFVNPSPSASKPVSEGKLVCGEAEQHRNLSMEIVRELDPLLGKNAPPLQALAEGGSRLEPVAGQMLSTSFSIGVKEVDAIHEYARSVLAFSELLQSLPSGEVKTQDDEFIDAIIAIQDSYQLVEAACFG